AAVKDLPLLLEEFGCSALGGLIETRDRLHSGSALPAGRRVEQGTAEDGCFSSRRSRPAKCGNDRAATGIVTGVPSRRSNATAEQPMPARVIHYHLARGSCAKPLCLQTSTIPGDTNSRDGCRLVP